MHRLKAAGVEYTFAEVYLTPRTVSPNLYFAHRTKSSAVVYPRQSISPVVSTPDGIEVATSPCKDAADPERNACDGVTAPCWRRTAIKHQESHLDRYRPGRSRTERVIKQNSHKHPANGLGSGPER